jgi:hypothetical protein
LGYVGQGADGLEVADFLQGAVEGALVRGLVAVEFSEASFGGNVFEGVWLVQEFFFPLGEAAELPGGGDELAEEFLFEAGGGIDGFAELGFEPVEEGLLVWGDLEDGGGESVGAGVLGGGLFALGGAGAGGAEGIEAVGVDLELRTHGKE